MSNLRGDLHLSHLGNEEGTFYTNLGGAAPLNLTNPFFRGDIDKIVSVDGYFGGMANSLSRGNDVTDSNSFMVDAISLIDLGYSKLKGLLGSSENVSRDTTIDARFFLDDKITTMKFTVPKTGNIYQNWNTGNNYDGLSNPYVKAKIDSVINSKVKK